MTEIRQSDVASPTSAAGLSEPHRCATVVIPALNEAARIASVVRHALADAATAEVVVIDDSSIDDTANLAREAGARVVQSSMLGKGTSMKDGALAATHNIIVYLDGDLGGLRDGLVSDLCRPILHDTADFVKARFGRAGGRVTELTAKPMLKVFFPEIAQFAQPLGGLIAARTNLMRSLTFEDGYGVDIGLLIDSHLAGARIVEVDIGALEYDSESITSLFRSVHRGQFERVANAMTIRPGVIEFVRAMRREGFMVGVVSDSWLVAADIMRRRGPAAWPLPPRVLDNGARHSARRSDDDALLEPGGGVGDACTVGAFWRLRVCEGVGGGDVLSRCKDRREV
jgi:beta-phosphoglucomutase-like phosphatase (HAD superfamily)